MQNKRLLVGVTGGVTGLLAVLLVKYGNPPNMGYCIACFLRDISGGLGFHKAAPVQYVRPEILGMVTGAFVAAALTREYRAVGGSSPLVRFFLAFTAMIGMLVFLGCPVRAVLRLAGGDWNAIVGIVGLVVGVGVGIYFLNRGFSLGRASVQHNINGYIFPGLTIILTGLVLSGVPVFYASTEGPGAMHAPVFLSLGAGVVVGVLAQRSRFCMIGGIRDFILFKDLHLLTGFFALLVVAFAGNLVTGAFNPGFTGQPVAHSDGLWNFLGMALGGTAVTLLGGCPLRQLIAAGEGNTDCVITVLGFVAGAAFAHNFGLAASPQGVPVAGQWAVVAGLVFVLGIGLWGAKQFAATGGVGLEQHH
ncbi:YedE-related selenium metabolism membrane protein [Desulfallas sp. Bu1-1]|uniref:YedE family putative selenium transporter n=1 Tax=Desulfallas sp. Bu1-1 TaxID=2787620 RepID=UPI00189C68C1|nr:YedE family putative selenium transporter [Desulfallas sp. Bu1-1]MBF7084484.1 YedE-related selenium metabolism membrane protein [Desulfallas sp. Bu1-1]